MDLSSEADGGASRLATYLQALSAALGHADRVAPFRSYCTGLLLPGERKSVEPIAARVGPGRVQAAHQSLHHFVAKADWSDQAVLAASHSTFLKNRDQLLDGAVAARFLATLMFQPKVKRLLSTDHFSVDGTLVQAWASMKSFKPVDGPDDPTPPSGGRNAETDFRGEVRSNATHASTTDPAAKLYRKGPGMEAKLAFLGHALMENRCGLLVNTCLTQANGHAERLAALAMIEKRADRPRAITLGTDKSYDTSDFVNELRSMRVRPHVARNTTRRHGRSAIDGRTTRHAGYAASQRIRKRIDEAFGWMKSIGGMRRPMLRGTHRVGWAFIFAAAYNLVRLPKLLQEGGS